MQIVLDGTATRDERQAWLAAQYVAFAYHSPGEMPPDPLKQVVTGQAGNDVTEEIRAIRRRVKVEYDTAKARRQHGR